MRSFLYILCFWKSVVNSYEMFLDYSTFVITEFGFIIGIYKSLNFPRFWEMRYYYLNAMSLLFYLF